MFSPALYTIFTNDCKPLYPDNCLLKFANDSGIQGLISDDETLYFKDVDDFINWYNNYLTVNVSKTTDIYFN